MSESELKKRVAELEDRIKVLEDLMEQHNEAGVIIGRWLKALSNNDLSVIQAVTYNLSADSEKRGKGKEIIESLFRFRDDMDEKIRTDDPE